tara:strand:- start:3553 stop:3813 length:261 start_codon:yes stop_codon:yes gene_type:complete
MSIGIWQIVLIIVVVLLLFGAGKLPRLMGDFAKGIKSFKAGIREGEIPPNEASKDSSVSENSKAIDNETKVSPQEIEEKRDDSAKS